MKKIYYLLVILIVVIFNVQFVCAGTKTGKCGENVSYYFDDNGTLTFSGTGEIYDYDCWGSRHSSPFSSTKMHVTNVVFNEGITGIGDYTFHTASLENVTFPSTMKKIGESAFAVCPSLKSIIIPDSVEVVGSHCFDFCYNLTDIVLPKNLTTIESGTFYKCNNLKNIKFPIALTCIKEDAFTFCDSLEQISLPYGLIEIEESAFFCENLKSVKIPSSVKNIDKWAFGYSKNLQEVYCVKGSVADDENLYPRKRNMNALEMIDYLGDGTEPKIESAVKFIYISDEDFKKELDFSNADKNINERRISVILNGNELSFDQSPYIENGTTRVPMRAIFEALDAEVDYDANTKTITVRKGSTIIKLVTGASSATINGREMKLTASVENKNGSTMVPLRFVSEALGAEVIWDGDNKIITINLEENEVTVRGFVLNADNDITINDGAMMYDLLKTNKVGHVNESDIHTLIEPSKKDFDTVINLIVKDADENDITYFYYSGHGGKKDGIAYICPDYYHINDDNSHDATYTYTYPELINKLSQIKGTVVIMLDCCFSGYINDDIENLNTDKFKILTSCKGDELSSIEDILNNPFDNKEVIHGQFTAPLLEGLGAYNNKVKADYNKDNKVTLSELYKYLEKNMSNTQNPTVSDKNDNTVIFAY